MSEEEGIVFMSVSVYPEHREMVDSYAREHKFSRSLAVRKIIDEWAVLTGRVTVDGDAGADCEQ